jgi:Zn finger protein HypA/HybF involved in hydrogenase expression
MGITCNRCNQEFESVEYFKTCPPCRERSRLRLIAFRSKHPDYNKTWHAKHREERQETYRKIARETKKQIWDHYFGGVHRCQRCGEKHDIRILHFHHNGGEDLERTGFYFRLKKMGFPKRDAKSLCPNCHAYVHLID